VISEIDFTIVSIWLKTASPAAVTCAETKQTSNNPVSHTRELLEIIWTRGPSLDY
jgi:hypothetical protein